MNAVSHADQSPRTSRSPNRRQMLKGAAAVGVSSALAPWTKLMGAAAPAATRAAAPATTAAAQPVPKPTKPVTVGIQMDVASLARGDINALLDNLRDRAGVNALFPFIYGHVNTWAGLPAAGYRGGNAAIPHMEYYKGSNLTYEDMRAPEWGEMDVLARTIAAARPRGVKTFAWILEDNRRVPLAHWEPFYEIDFKGQRTEGHPSGPCYNNPLYRAFILGLAEDYTRSYEIDGVMWSSERQGGLYNALGAWHHGETADPGKATCFCEFCVAKGKADGIDVERTKLGFGELEKFVRAGRAKQRPIDGYYVTWLRLLQNYPELLAWENLWIRSRAAFMREIYAKVKGIKPELPVGWHIWHNVSFSPMHRAEVDYKAMTAYSDYIKPVLYANCAGERIKSFADSVSENVFGDFAPADTLAMLYKMLDYPNEAPYDRVTAAGLSPDYVRRETKRAVDDVAGAKVEIWPGLDVDVPVPAGAGKCTPETVKQSVLAAFRGGARGVVLSRNYSEMTQENLAGAGAALREMGVG